MRTNGTLFTWGHNNQGQLGLNDQQAYNSPVQIPGTWSNFSLVGYSGAAVKTNGQLWMWGRNEEGQLGLNSRTDYSSPKQVPGTWAWGQAGKKNSFGGKTDGTLWAWGKNSFGALGLNQPHNTRYSSPVQVPGTNWPTNLDLFSGNYYAPNCALKQDGTLWLWGGNNFGSMGTNDEIQYSSPVQIPGVYTGIVKGDQATHHTNGALG